jgi:hypothetical protein
MSVTTRRYAARDFYRLTDFEKIRRNAHTVIDTDAGVSFDSPGDRCARVVENLYKQRRMRVQPYDLEQRAFEFLYLSGELDSRVMCERGAWQRQHKYGAAEVKRHKSKAEDFP